MLQPGAPRPRGSAPLGRTWKPDLLNFKKGWMSILDEPGEWKKHWFVLTDSSLKYYRDSTAEEADELDGEIDLRACTDVTEYAVQRNYGFQIHTKDAVYTLSAMTSGIRRNWIEALRKTVRPTSAPDVTKLSDCNKENTLHGPATQKGSLKAGEQRGGPRKADGQRQSLDYVELSPLTQGSPQRARAPARASDRPAKQEELERDLAQRSEERRKWFEASDSRAPETATGEGPRRGLGAPLTEDQQSRLSEEIEKKWQELEKLPLRENKRVPLTALLTQSRAERRGAPGDSHEALEKEVQSLRAQLEAWRLRGEAPQNPPRSQEDAPIPPGYISQEACERSLAQMESSHQQVMEELQRHHERELQRLQQEKEWLLAEETAATASAIEAMKKAYQEELSRELSKTRCLQQGPDGLRKQHQSDVEALKRELQVLSEQYSQKCLEIGALTRQAEEREHTLRRCQQEGQELLRHNQELHSRLSEEIDRLRGFIASQGAGGSGRNERSSCELEVSTLPSGREPAFWGGGVTPRWGAPGLQGLGPAGKADFPKSEHLLCARSQHTAPPPAPAPSPARSVTLRVTPPLGSVKWACTSSAGRGQSGDVCVWSPDRPGVASAGPPPHKAGTPGSPSCLSPASPTAPRVQCCSHGHRLQGSQGVVGVASASRPIASATSALGVGAAREEAQSTVVPVRLRRPPRPPTEGLGLRWAALGLALGCPLLRCGQVRGEVREVENRSGLPGGACLWKAVFVQVRGASRGPRQGRSQVPGCLWPLARVSLAPVTAGAAAREGEGAPVPEEGGAVPAGRAADAAAGAWGRGLAGGGAGVPEEGAADAAAGVWGGGGAGELPASPWGVPSLSTDKGAEAGKGGGACSGPRVL
uniref:PH domain-containing protein n=1 Tax=Oryctolagus cuniculus TaxID=9986 RepID=A0A5F9D3H6_RABIT